jgi:hypothetical protein
MPETIGAVRCVRVAEGSAFACIREQGATTNELFFLWWDGVTTPADPPPAARIVQSNWVAMLRQALASNIPITITHDDNSAIVLNLQLGLE